MYIPTPGISRKSFISSKINEKFRVNDSNCGLKYTLDQIEFPATRY